MRVDCLCKFLFSYLTKIAFILLSANSPVEDGVNELSELSPAGMYSCAAYCMNAILGSAVFPKSLPRQVPVKVNICTKLVAEIKVSLTVDK